MALTVSRQGRIKLLGAIDAAGLGPLLKNKWAIICLHFIGCAQLGSQNAGLVY